jgi:DNA-binding transcriptional MocR family regulator
VTEANDRQALQTRIEALRARKLALDMTRGKPGPEQLDLAGGLFTVLDREGFRTASGLDARNYGGLDGFPEAKQLFAGLLEVSPEELIIGGNSSLNMMYDAVAQCMTQGVLGGKPWFGQEVSFLCPVPGYDRHFAICEHFGIRMIPVPMNEDGPLMDEVERLAGRDASVRGMWCVPKYSNPSGAVYADEVVEGLAAMKTAAADFRILWDNAYAVHHLGGGPAPLANILEACKRNGNPERVLIFGSTSKISFPGAGVALMGGSRASMDWARLRLGAQTIGPDKLNILRHLLYFRDMAGILAHMDRHAAVLAPKFAAVQETLQRELGGSGLATWSRPRGGYFVSLDTPPGCASRAVSLAAELGVKFTRAGATWPYGRDPGDANIRIAPTLPPLEQIHSAVEVLAVCIRWASLETGGWA